MAGAQPDSAMADAETETGEIATLSNVRSSTVEQRHRVTWTVDDFSSLVKTADYDEDAKDGKAGWQFLATHEYRVNDKIKFVLTIQACPDDDNKRYDYGIYLKSVSEANVKDYFVEYTFAVRRADGKFYWPKIYMTKKVPHFGHGYSKLLNDFADKSSVTMGCDFKLIRRCGKATEITTQMAQIRNLKRPSETLGSDLERMRKTAKSADVNLVSEGKIIQAASYVLRARSKVFEAMLTHDMREKKTKRIEIEDVRAPVVEAFVAFLHSDAFEDDYAELALELMIMADRYEVKSLIYECEKSLLKTFDKKNAFNLLESAVQCGAEQLKKLCIATVANIKNLKKQKEFKALEKRDPALALAVCKRFMC